MVAIINCESNFEPTIQSRHTYHERNVPKGFKVGDREQSFGLVQIHLPAHPNISREQAINPEFAVDFLAKSIKDGRIGMWSCARDLAMI